MITSDNRASGGSRLDALCGQFEEVLLRGLLPHGMFRANAWSFDGDAAAPDGADSSALEAMFAQSLASALERAGGLGLAREMSQALEGDRT